MKLLALDDERWKTYRSGYNRVVLDTVAWIGELLSGSFPANHWDFLWDELHHQGDVGEASYAVVPYLSRYAKESGSNEWHIWGYTVVVELARLDGQNPDLPKEIESSYFDAVQELAQLAMSKSYWHEDVAGCMAACIALAKGQPIFARAYLEMAAKDTALSFIKEETGWVQER